MPTIRPACTGSASSPASKNSVSGFSIRISPRRRGHGRSVERGPVPVERLDEGRDSGCARRPAPRPSRRRRLPRSRRMPRRIRVARDALEAHEDRRRPAPLERRDRGEVAAILVAERQRRAGSRRPCGIPSAASFCAARRRRRRESGKPGRAGGVGPGRRRRVGVRYALGSVEGQGDQAELEHVAVLDRDRHAGRERGSR